MRANTTMAYSRSSALIR